MLQPIIPIIRREPFDDPAYLFELKLDGFRGLADTVNGRMLSKNGNRLKRFERLLEALPPGYVFDGEIVALDEQGRPRFNDLLFGRREPEKIVRRYGLQKSEPVLDDGKAAFKAVCGLDLEGIVAMFRCPIRAILALRCGSTGMARFTRQRSPSASRAQTILWGRRPA